MSNQRNPRNNRDRGNQSRRRNNNNRGRSPQQQAPKGPAMTALGESTYEAVFDHGSEGYGIWFDGVVREDPMYRQHWKGLGTRPIFVKIEEDRIVVSRQIDRNQYSGVDQDSSSAADSDEDSVASSNDQTTQQLAESLTASIEAAEASTGSSDIVYTPEEAARLFAADSGPGVAAPVETTGDDAPEAEASTDAVESESDGDAAPAKPRRTAARRTTTTARRRTTTRAKDDAADDAPAAE